MNKTTARSVEQNFFLIIVSNSFVQPLVLLKVHATLKHTYFVVGARRYATPRAPTRHATKRK